MDLRLSLGLNRPQYVPSPEVLVSALVWGTGEWTYPDETIWASRFKGDKGNRADLVSTAPESAAQVQAFAALLRAGGLQTEAPDTVLVDAVLNGVTGVKSQKAKAVPASPMTPHLALSQSPRGVLGVNNPPDIGGILETMFALGSPDLKGASPDSLATLWIQASNRRLDDDAVLRAADAAMKNSMGLVREENSKSTGHQSSAAWAGHLRDSPFGWLHDHWRKITSPQWVDALPPRVWTDWCTTILRMGMAFGYLFECRWFESIGRTMLADGELQEGVLGSTSPLLMWPGSRLPVSSRNVKPEMKALVRNGVLVRSVLGDHFKRDFGEVGVHEVLSQARSSVELRRSVRDSLSSNSWPGSCKNTYETILYSLQQRDTSAEVDYYGLLRRHGNRFSVIHPGTEWIAIVASLACDNPGGETHLGQVLGNLSQLGLQPELMELVRSLEAAGLAQGSADADHGVRVRSAY